MTNMYHNDNEQNETGYQQRPVQYYPVVKEKKSHKILKGLLSILLAFAAGLGGSIVGMKYFGKEKTTVIYQQAEPIQTTTNTAVQATSNELSLQQIAEKASVSVVEIRTTVEGQGGYGFFSMPYTAESAGSGVIISNDGYIITNNHVIEDSTSITVKTSDGTTYDATVIGSDAKSDIGVVKINATGLIPATIGDSSLIRVGDTAVAIGNPLGTLGGTVTNGIISATDREVVINNEAMNLIQTNAAINGGNSGGGLFNGQGDLIGIVNAKDSGIASNGSVVEGLGFAIPVNEAMDVAEQLINHGTVTDRPMLGVTLQTVNQSSYYNLEPGLYISDVMSNSGAEKAGLKAGDKIIEADGQSVSSYTDLSRILRKKAIGDTMEIRVIRQQEEMEFFVTLTGTLSVK